MKGRAMNAGCDYLGACGFYRKFGPRKSNVWKGLVSFYCTGKGFNLCERRKKYLAGIVQVSDDILPNGQEVSKAFLSLA